MELSKRLYAVAGLVTEGASVADIGTDHGYVPIYLIEQRIADKVIALDINRGPLERARSHIASYGLSDRIEIRLSDGLLNVFPGEADTMIAAGMGGGLVIKILTEGKEITDTLKECILQPQSEIDKVRKYLVKNGFSIIAEDMVEEEGKYYPMMKAVHTIDSEDISQPEYYEEYEYRYGKRLLELQHPVLKKFLHRELKIQEEICAKLQELPGSERTHNRLKEIQKETEYIRQALKCFV